MVHQLRRIGFGLLTTLAIVAFAGPGHAAQERFEVSSIKAVRPTLVDTLAALKQKDVAKARAAFHRYDSAWNGIEVYINTRSKDMYDLLEHDLQARIEKGLEAPNPDTTKLAADAQEMLNKYDDAIKMVSAAKPLNPLYDDVARLRIVRAPLRDVAPDLKAGKLADARKAYEAFDSKWDSIEDLVKARSADDYVAVEKGMIQIEKALMPDKPNAAEVTALVNDVMSKYNDALAAVVKEARNGK